MTLADDTLHVAGLAIIFAALAVGYAKVFSKAHRPQRRDPIADRRAFLRRLGLVLLTVWIGLTLILASLVHQGLIPRFAGVAVIAYGLLGAICRASFGPRMIRP